MGCSGNYFSQSMMTPFQFVLLHQLLWALLIQLREMRGVQGTPAGPSAHRVIPVLGSLWWSSLTWCWGFRQGTHCRELFPRDAGSSGCLLAVILHWYLAAPLSDLGKTGEKTLLQKSVVSDRLQRLLQPKLLKWVLPQNPLFCCWEHCMGKEKGDVEFHLPPTSSCANCLCDFTAIHFFPLALWCNLKYFAGLETEVVLCGDV